jgi:hypothetical protein
MERILWVFKRAETYAVLSAAAVVTICWCVYRSLTDAQVTFENLSKIVELGILGVGLVSLLLIFQQNQQVRRWNKILSYHQFFGDLISDEMAAKIQQTVNACGAAVEVAANNPISAESARAMAESDDHKQVVSSYLDEFEEFCGAVNAGVVQEEYAYSLEATRVIRTWNVYKPYIELRRSSFKNSLFYLELEVVAGRWSEERQKKVASANKKAGMRNHV